MRIAKYYLCLLTTMWLASACDDSGPKKTGEKEYVPATDIYSEDSAPERLVSREVDGVLEEFPDDQLLVLFTVEGYTPENLVALAQTLDGTLIGENPALELAQFRIPPKTPEEMDLLIVSVETSPLVEGAMPNLLLEAASDAQECRDRGDSDSYFANGTTVKERCALEYPDFFSTVPLLRHLRSDSRAWPVKIGIVDLDFAGLQSQFFFTRWQHLNLFKTETFEDNVSGHGLQVMGVLAADEDQDLTGSVLPAMLGSTNVSYFIGSLPASDAAHRKSKIIDVLNTMTRAARDAMVDILNLSHRILLAPGTSNSRNVINAFKKMMTQHPETLFVCAAGNDGITLTGDNSAPGGIRSIDNLVTVSGTHACDPTSRHPESNYGSGSIMVSASYEYGTINPEDPGGTTILDVGTSLGTPVVVGLAGIIKWLVPQLTPAEIKEYLILNGNLHDPSLGPYIQFSRTILNVLRDHRSEDTQLMELISRSDDEEPVSFVMDRLCGNFLVSVEGVDQWWLESDVEAGQGCVVMGLGNPAVTLQMGVEEGESVMSLSAQVYQLLLLGTAIPFSQANVGFYYNPSLEEQYNGLSSDGEFMFTSCLVTQRDDRYLPLAIELEGTLSGTLHLQHLPPATEADYPLTSHFVLTCPVMVGDGLDPMVRAIETQCYAGNQR
jgi:hypothetical protein